VVFLDASAVIYLLEGNRAVQRAARATLANLGTSQSEPALAVSALSRLECRGHPLRHGDQARLTRFDNFFSDPGLLTVDLTRTVIDHATDLRANHGLRTPDALQAACCLAIDPQTPFVTGDKEFEKLKPLNTRLIE
jgi:predicted nucleic acid-binding protein